MKLDKKTKDLIFYSICIIAFVFMIVSWIKKTQNMLKNPRFTIGTVSSDWHSKSTFKTAGNDFEYYINGKRYEFATKSLPRGIPIGEKYLVVFDSTDLDNPSWLLTKYPIPDSIPAPTNGWSLDEIPLPIDWDEIEQEIKEANFIK